MTSRRVTLLSDFGTVDGYAAAMAGVIAAAAPSARIVHSSHDIPPGDIPTAALTLSRYAFLYPEKTVHLVVVDPGVGTGRRAIAAAIQGRFFVAPDNGVLSRVLRDGPEPALVELDEDRLSPASRRSATFHGRDLFAPAAGRLARGEALESLGPAIADPVLLSAPVPHRSAAGIAGEVVRVDHFGNLITNIPGTWLEAEHAVIRVEGRSVGRLRRTYGDVVSGAALALVGSLGVLEVSVRDGSAADRLGAGRGARVTIGS